MNRWRIGFASAALLALVACRTERAPAPASDTASGGAVPASAPAPAPAQSAPAADGDVPAPGAGPAVTMTSAVGKYSVELPAADVSARLITLDLRPDSTCVLKTEYTGKGQHVESGVWSVDGDLVRLRLGPPRFPDKQRHFAFAAWADSLVSREWDRTLYGSEGLRTLVRR